MNYACINEYFFKNFFGGYATPRKYAVFSRLAMNGYFYMKDYEGKYSKMVVHEETGTEKRTLGRTSVEPVILCSDGQ